MGCMKGKSVSQFANDVRFQHCRFHQATCTSRKSPSTGSFSMDESVMVIEIIS